MTTPVAPHPRRVAFIIVTICFALFCLNAWGQVVMTALGFNREPRLLTFLQTLSGASAYAAAVGTFRRRNWASVAALIWGVVTGGMIFSLGSILELDAVARKGLISGALSVLLIGSGLALYLRSALRPPR